MKSKYIGVAWDHSRKKWCARRWITTRRLHPRTLHRGHKYFDSEIEAAQHSDLLLLNHAIAYLEEDFNFVTIVTL